MSVKTLLTGWEVKSRFQRSMTAAAASRTVRPVTAFGSAAVVSGMVVGLVSVAIGLGLISPGAVAG